MTRDQLAAWVARTRADQGLPPTITDLVTITTFAILVADGRRELSQLGTVGEVVADGRAA